MLKKAQISKKQTTINKNQREVDDLKE